MVGSRGGALRLQTQFLRDEGATHLADHIGITDHDEPVGGPGQADIQPLPRPLAWRRGRRHP